MKRLRLMVMVLAACAVPAMWGQGAGLPTAQQLSAVEADIERVDRLLKIQRTDVERLVQRLQENHPDVIRTRDAAKRLEAELRALSAQRQALEHELDARKSESLMAQERKPFPERLTAMQELLSRQQQLSAGQGFSYSYGSGGRAAVPSGPMPERWWRDATMAMLVGVTSEQKQKMDEVFLQHRPKLIDANAALEKEELKLEPLVGAEKLDEGAVSAQIDRIAQARAELEKTTGRMLLGIRKVLTPEQWRRLSERQGGKK